MHPRPIVRSLEKLESFSATYSLAECTDVKGMAIQPSITSQCSHPAAPAAMNLIDRVDISPAQIVSATEEAESTEKEEI